MSWVVQIHKRGRGGVVKYERHTFESKQQAEALQDDF